MMYLYMWSEHTPCLNLYSFSKVVLLSQDLRWVWPIINLEVKFPKYISLVMDYSTNHGLCLLCTFCSSGRTQDSRKPMLVSCTWVFVLDRSSWLSGNASDISLVSRLILCLFKCNHIVLVMHKMYNVWQKICSWNGSQCEPWISFQCSNFDALLWNWILLIMQSLFVM